MSDHDAAPDPIDQAYVQAEAMLSDEAARAARRARVLAAVAQAAAPSLAAAAPAVAAAAPAPRPAMRRPAWRPGGWLAVACVVGLSVFLAVKLYQPTPFQPQTAPAASPSPKTGAPAPLAPTPPTPEAPSQAAPSQAAASTQAREIATARTSPEPAAPSSETSARQPPDAAAPVEKPAQPPLAIAPIVPAPPAPRAFPAPAPPPPPVVASEQAETPRAANDTTSASAGASDEVAAKAQGSLAGMAPRRAAFASAHVAGAPSDQAARLRDAAAAGRTAEVEDLLSQGAPVDAPDAAGDTALMKSLQGNHPAAAAALRRHGASLDHKNHAGESARDIATTKADPELDRAIGVGP